MTTSVDAAKPFAALILEVRDVLDPRLSQWLAPRVAAATQVSAEVGMAAEAVATLTLRGGKRVRAALIAAAYMGVANDRSWSPLCEESMIAVELLQTYLLIHDDWMDGDDVRRGGPAVHALLRERLGSASLGDAAAICAGDLASGYAQEALLETRVSADRLLRAMKAFARIQIDVVTGQLAEMSATAPKGPALLGMSSVETIHALKTASYTVTGPLLLGAALAGGDDVRSAELERFGRPLGIAFQLRDDLLGVFGDPSATGKPVGNDIRQGKRTALVAELRTEPRAEALLVAARADAATQDDVNRVVRLMDESGARSRVEARVRELCAEARNALENIALSNDGKAVLAGAVTALGERSS